jgi:hypothetical protein
VGGGGAGAPPPRPHHRGVAMCARARIATNSAPRATDGGRRYSGRVMTRQIDENEAKSWIDGGWRMATDDDRRRTTDDYDARDDDATDARDDATDDATDDARRATPDDDGDARDDDDVIDGERKG